MIAKRIFRVFASVVIVLITLALGECALRATMQMTWRSPTFVDDRDIGFRMRGALRVGDGTTNAFGFNDVDRSRVKPEGVRRVAIVGDSFLFGVVPRAANFVSGIQRFADAAHANVEVLNMGIPGAGPKNYLRIIRKDAVDRQADFVAVVLFLGNDLMQAHPASRTFAVDSANYDYAALPVDLTRDLDAAGVATLRSGRSCELGWGFDEASWPRRVQIALNGSAISKPVVGVWTLG